MTNTLTHTTITRVPELAPNLPALQQAVADAELAYGNAAYAVSKAWALYDEAVEEHPEDVELFWYEVQQVERTKHEAYLRLGAAKHDLLDMWQ